VDSLRETLQNSFRGQSYGLPKFFEHFEQVQNFWQFLAFLAFWTSLAHNFDPVGKIRVGRCPSLYQLFETNTFCFMWKRCPTNHRGSRKQILNFEKNFSKFLKFFKNPKFSKLVGRTRILIENCSHAKIKWIRFEKRSKIPFVGKVMASQSFLSILNKFKIFGNFWRF